MAVENRNILKRVYLVALVVLIMATAIGVKLTNIQWVEGSYYRKLANERSVRKFIIPAK